MYQFFCSQVPSSVVERLFNLQELPLLHQKEHNLLLLLDAFFKGWDAQLWHQTASGLLYHEGSRLHINRATTFRIIWRSDSDSESVDFPRYFFSGFLSEQVGRYPLSGMCFLIWRIILWTNAMGSDSGISLPRVYNIPTNSLFMRVKMIQIECVLDDCWSFYSDSGVQSNLSLITITNDGFVLQLVWTTSLSFSTFLGMDWTVCLVLWPWFFRWCSWIIWLLRLLWFSTCSHSCLKPSLDYALVPDKFLCSVRSLRGYLDKSKISGKARKFFL